jgi:2'-5' RNA ligase
MPAKKMFDPHMTIGRELEKERFDIAIELLKDRQLEMRFLCNQLVIRVFDHDTSQYQIGSRYDFGGMTLF